VQSPSVKICGITRLEDAQAAFELGAWAVGMIFYEGSPRRCELAEAERIGAALHRRGELAGVFVNSSLATIADVNERVGLTLVQLHGDEGPSFCAEVARRTGARTIKAASVRAPRPCRISPASTRTSTSSTATPRACVAEPARRSTGRWWTDAGRRCR
jgi:phosphoribosylanthranilate isomerase